MIMAFDTYEKPIDRHELFEKTRERYRTLLAQIGVAITTTLWFSYLMYVIIGWVGEPESVPPLEDVKGLLWKSFAAWAAATVAIYPIFSKIGTILGDRAVIRRIEERRRRMVEQQLFLEMMKADRNANVRTEGGIFYIEGLTPWGETVSEQIADLRGLLDEFFERFRILKSEVVSVTIRAPDREIGTIFEEWARKYFSEARPIIRVVVERPGLMAPPRRGVKIDLVIA
ncbi:MAG TPA: hypothetical protein ENG69_05480 [Candidatus Korarchaeota archaeon]|nr:hypothetical protein [Candidatus Korarchaeota archaeon]